MLRGMVSVAVVLCISVAAQAAVITPSVTSSVISLPGYTIYTVNLSTDTGVITDLDISIQGSMFQGLTTPSGYICGAYLPEPPPGTMELYVYLPSAPPLDSCFLFNASDVYGTGSESSTHLTGIMTLPGPMSASSVDVVQVILADGNTATVSGFVSTDTDSYALSQFTIPEPASAALLAIGSLGLMLRRRRK